MATGAKGRANQRSNGGFSSYSSTDPLDVGNDPKSDAPAIILIVILLVVILFFLPLLGWMYVDIRSMEIRVDKALARIENK